MTKHEIEKEITDLSIKIEALANRMNHLASLLRSKNALEFIQANSMRLEDVETCQGKSYFNDTTFFENRTELARWLSVNSKKPWAEWYGQIHRSKDLIAGYFKPTPARLEDLEGLE
jgi:hypothetical protein